MDRFEQLREGLSLREAMDHLFRESFVRGPGSGRGVSVPVDLHETRDGFELCASLPGWNPEDINITVQGDGLTISGQHRRADDNPERSFHLRERSVGSFVRSFNFGVPIDADGIEANYRNGELILTIPKSARARPRQIRIAGHAPAGEVLERMGMRDISTSGTERSEPAPAAEGQTRRGGSNGANKVKRAG